ncbi:MAG TPA: TIGR04282 family arsenosugar biosynthesis glycosyltransferase [Candidatus Limnocylindria bacterium]|jgi:rSAM/selenodomain-associated transferase 1|nr:TIGR04282 family arsenosugar biosynthesis glycosyltransferase [Candidatus Limnocylindria bacterium]
MKILLFLKAPRLGFVKTRLAKDLGPAGALSAYRQMLQATVEVLCPFPNVALRYTPDDSTDEVGSWAKPGWRLEPQGDGDLGERLTRAFADAFANGANPVVAIGSDCPYVSAADLREAQDLLQTNDVVLGPAVDGGYWLIGTRRALPQLFEGIDWSTERVFEQTCRAANVAGLTVARLRTLSDVDTSEDWQRWQTILGKP